MPNTIFIDTREPGAKPCFGSRTDYRNTTCAVIHIATETYRHAGHADTVSELIDSSASLLPAMRICPNTTKPGGCYRHKVETAARHLGDGSVSLG